MAFLLHFSSYAQTRNVIAVNAKFKIEDNSNYADAYMVLERDGKKIQTLTGQSSYKLNLEILHSIIQQAGIHHQKNKL